MPVNQGALPLDGIRILDLSRLIPGGVCTTMLADLGAEVIKVEATRVGAYERQIPPFIGGMASRFLLLNRNKKSFSVNLKHPEGRNAFLALARSADVLLESFRPGAMAKLELDHESLKGINPGLIYCSISSFGQDGPDRDVVAHDINILALTGILDITGNEESGPVLPGIQIVDSAAGNAAALGIMAALMSRTKNGLGQMVDISMYDCALALTFDASRYVFAGDDLPARGEARLWGGLPNYRVYRTKDGKYLAVGSLEAKFQEALAARLGGGGGGGDSGAATTTVVDQAARDEAQRWRELFATRTRREWLDDLADLNICVSPVLGVDEALKLPQARHRKMIIETGHPAAGPTRLLGSPLKLSSHDINLDRLPAPLLGEHTAELLTGLGYSDTEIDSLAAGGAILAAS